MNHKARADQRTDAIAESPTQPSHGDARRTNVSPPASRTPSLHLFWMAAVVSTGVLFASGCLKTTHEVRTQHEIKPIHIAVDVNLRVDRELNDFFGDLDRESSLVQFDGGES